MLDREEVFKQFDLILKKLNKEGFLIIEDWDPSFNHTNINGHNKKLMTFKMNYSNLLEQNGTPITIDFTIDLNSNWNLLGYWLHESMPPEDAYNELILNDNLIYVTGFNEDGAVFFDPNGLRLELTYQHASIQTLNNYKKNII